VADTAYCDFPDSTQAVSLQLADASAGVTGRETYALCNQNLAPNGGFATAVAGSLAAGPCFVGTCTVSLSVPADSIGYCTGEPIPCNIPGAPAPVFLYRLTLTSPDTLTVDSAGTPREGLPGVPATVFVRQTSPMSADVGMRRRPASLASSPASSSVRRPHR